MREPKVEWMTRWVSPTSSKKRSNTMVSSVGSVPSAAWPAARYWASCWAATASSCFSSRSHASSASGPPSASCPSASARRRETAAESSSLRAGASPTQNGSVGAMPRASSTKILFTSTFCTRYEVLPSWKMSPGMLSNAKSSPTEPMRKPSGFSTTS